jgi:hypothetical protein
MPWLRGAFDRSTEIGLASFIYLIRMLGLIEEEALNLNYEIGLFPQLASDTHFLRLAILDASSRKDPIGAIGSMMLVSDQ